MTGQLIGTGDSGGAPARCACGAEAAGPCARCHKPLCGDCCIITEHGAKPWAICLACNRRGGNSLRQGWIRVWGWLLIPLCLLLALVVALYSWAGP